LVQHYLYLPIDVKEIHYYKLKKESISVKKNLPFLSWKNGDNGPLNVLLDSKTTIDEYQQMKGKKSEKK